MQQRRELVMSLDALTAWQNWMDLLNHPQRLILYTWREQEEPYPQPLHCPAALDPDELSICAPDSSWTVG